MSASANRPMALGSALGALFLMISCSGSSAWTGALETLSDEQRNQFLNVAEELENRVGFRIILPRYLPAGMDWLPDTHYINDHLQREASLTFFPRSDYRDTSDMPVLVLLDISEQYDPGRKSCPPCPGDADFGFEELRLDGDLAAAEEVRSGERMVGYSLSFRAGDVLIRASFDWEVAETAAVKVTDEMQQEARRVAESMLPSD